MSIALRAAGLFLLGLAARAVAQPPAEVPHWAQSLAPALPGEMQRTMQYYRDFITCSATTDWRLARPIFDTDIGSRAQVALIDHLYGGSHGNFCNPAFQLHLTDMLMRGGVAEARYRHIYATGPIPPATTEPAPVLDGAGFAWVGFGRESPPGLLYAFANCLAERETGSVHVLLMTDFGSNAERAANQALGRRFGTCLPAGTTLRANPVTLRPWLAEAQYQYFRRQRPDTGN